MSIWLIIAILVSLGLFGLLAYLALRQRDRHR